MQAGEMVPTDLVLDLLIAAMDESGMTRFLIDGYPRTLEQLKEFEEKVSRALLTGGGGCCSLVMYLAFILQLALWWRVLTLS